MCRIGEAHTRTELTLDATSFSKTNCCTKVLRAKLHKDKLPPKLTNIQNSECGTESAKVKYIGC